MRRARRHAGLGLDEADKIEAKAARKIGPAVVVGDHRHRPERAQLAFPFRQFCIQAREKCLPVRFIGRGVCRIDPRQGLKNVCGDGLGVLRIEPIVRIAAAMGVAVSGTDAHSAQLKYSYCKRRIDIGGPAAADLRPPHLCQQAINPEVIVETDAHEQPRLLETQRVLRLWLVFLGVQARWHEANGRDAIPTDSLGEAAQIGRRRHHLQAFLSAFLRECRRRDGKQRDDESGTQHHDREEEGRAALRRPSPVLANDCRRPRCSWA